MFRSLLSYNMFVNFRCRMYCIYMNCKSDVWAALQEMSENAHASVVSSSIFFTQSWLIFVTFLYRLDYRGWHRFALVVTGTQDVQFVM